MSFNENQISYMIESAKPMKVSGMVDDCIFTYQNKGLHRVCTIMPIPLQPYEKPLEFELSERDDNINYDDFVEMVRFVLFTKTCAFC